MPLVHFKKASLSLYVRTPFKEEFTDYCSILKVTRVFPYSYTGKVDQTEDSQHFANDQN